MRRIRRTAPMLLAGLLCACPPAGREAAAWTPRMDERVASEAVRLMPAALRGILETHAAEVRAGLAEAAAWGPGAPPTEALVEEIIGMIDDHRPFSEVARRMGALAHVIGGLNNPLKAASHGSSGSAYAADYEAYVESNIPRYRLVFYGWSDPHLGIPGPPRAGGARAFAEEAAGRARRHAVHIHRAYAPDNPVPLAQRFDVRSLPFGIGALSYSHSVTDTARIWLHIWGRSHGDMSGTPYLAQEIRKGRMAGGQP